MACSTVWPALTRYALRPETVRKRSVRYGSCFSVRAIQAPAFRLGEGENSSIVAGTRQVTSRRSAVSAWEATRAVLSRADYDIVTGVSIASPDGSLDCGGLILASKAGH